VIILQRRRWFLGFRQKPLINFESFVYVFFAKKMGIEINRFQGEVDEELLCPICSGVLENPLQV